MGPLRDIAEHAILEQIRLHVNEEVAKEREACARIAEAWMDTGNIGSCIARDIRKRGE